MPKKWNGVFPRWREPQPSFREDRRTYFPGNRMCVHSQTDSTKREIRPSEGRGFLKHRCSPDAQSMSYVGGRQAKPHFTCIWKETLWQYSRSGMINVTDASFVIKPPQNNKQYLNEGRSLVTMAVNKLSEKKGKEKKPSSSYSITAPQTAVASSASVQHLLDAHPPVGTPTATFDEDKRKTWQGRSEQDDWIFKCQGTEASQRVPGCSAAWSGMKDRFRAPKTPKQPFSHTNPSGPYSHIRTWLCYQHVFPNLMLPKGRCSPYMSPHLSAGSQKAFSLALSSFPARIRVLFCVLS